MPVPQGQVLAPRQGEAPFPSAAVAAPALVPAGAGTVCVSQGELDSRLLANIRPPHSHSQKWPHLHGTSSSSDSDIDTYSDSDTSSDSDGDTLPLLHVVMAM